MDVFVSYARTDQRFVDRLMGDLEADGFGVWRDVDKLRGGDTWREAISEAIRGSDAVVIVLSPDSVASRNVSKELSVAEERNKRIVPVLHRPARLEGAMELLLTDLQHVDFTRDFDAGLRSLLSTLRRAPARRGRALAPRRSAGPKRHGRPGVRAAIALVAVAALIASAATLAVLTRSNGASRSSTTTTPATTSPPTSPAQPTSSPTTRAPVT